MATNVGASNISLGADISKLVNGLKTAGKTVQSFTYDINTNLTNSYKKADTQAKTFRSGLIRLGNDIEGLGRKLTYIGTLPVIFGGAAAVKEFANLERLDIALKQYGETLEDVKKLAKLPNISVEGAANSLIQLRAVGVESDFAAKAIKNVANALTAAGKSSADLNPALANIVQMLSTGVVSAADVKELANRVPQARKALIDAFGTASGEELTKKGVKTVVDGLIEQLGKIPPVTAGAATGFEQLSDSVKFATAQAGSAIARATDLTENLKKAGDTVDRLTESFASLSPETQTIIVKFGVLVAAIGPLLIGMAQIIRLAPAVATGWALIGGPITILTVAIAGLVIYFKEIIGLLDTVALKFRAFYTALAVNPTTSFIANELKNLSTLADLVLGYNSKQRSSSQPTPAGVSTVNDIFATKSATKIPYLRGKEVFDAEPIKKVTTETSKAVKIQSEYTDSHSRYVKVLAQEKQYYQDLKNIAASIKPLNLIGIGSAGSGDAAFDKAMAADKATSATSGIKVGLTDGIKSQIDAAVKPLQEFKSFLNDQGWSGTQIESFFKRFPQSVGESTEDYVASLDKIESRSAAITNAINSSMVQLGTGIASTIGETLGDLASGIDSAGNFGTKILALLGSTLKDLGKALVGIGLASDALKKSFSNPYLAIAVGVATIAAGQVISNNAQKKINASTTRFAKGGFAYGEMHAIVGDNPNARFDPEMIAPYSKVSQSIEKSVKDSIGNNSGGDFKQVGVRIQGSDLYVILEREKKRNASIRG